MPLLMTIVLNSVTLPENIAGEFALASSIDGSDDTSQAYAIVFEVNRSAVPLEQFYIIVVLSACYRHRNDDGNDYKVSYSCFGRQSNRTLSSPFIPLVVAGTPFRLLLYTTIVVVRHGKQ